MKAFISRDPFAREEIWREKIDTKTECDWCGQNRFGRLFIYCIQTDDGREYQITGQFCSVGCLHSYHDGR